MKNPRLITGIQPTNRITIGNYLGAIKNQIKYQDDYECFLFVADLHCITIPLAFHKFNYQEIEEFKWKLIKTYIACGIDIKKTKIFIQSEVKEHLELFYFLLTHSSVGELKRMTQYKQLSKQFLLPNGTEMSLAGLLIYPVLMAADILIYDSDYVSIGDDQTQHLELTVNLAEKINSKYKKDIFSIPKSFNNQIGKSNIRIKDLQNPESKMSKKSKDYEGVIFLDDELEDIRKKILKAKTDSIGIINWDPVNQPGITNLLEIYSSINDIDTKEAVSIFKNKTYQELKEYVAESVMKEIATIQEKYKNIDEKEIRTLIQENNLYCRKIASSKLHQIKNSI